MIVIISAMAYLIATAQAQRPRENGLEEFLLASASFVASFLVTKIYAQETYSQTLRDHGVQIASGIMVLKRQIERLTDWVSGKRSLLSRDANQANTATDACLEHVQESLEGFLGLTDAALGGIAGVIGAALAEYETVMQQISRIRADTLAQTRSHLINTSGG